MKLTLLSMALFVASLINAQTVELKLNHLYDGNTYQLNEVIETEDYNFKIIRLQYYLSNFTVTHDGGTETYINDSYVLANITDNSNYSLGSLSGVTNLENIQFHFGVDETMNHADPALQASNHPLAYQSPSMHWGWSGGYMFAVMEGEVDVNKDGTYEKYFDFMPVNDKYFKQVNLPSNDATNGGKLIINVDVEIANWLDGFTLNTVGSNHGTNSNLNQFSKVDTKNVFSTDAVLDVTEINSKQLITVKNNGASPVISLHTASNSNFIEISDLNGKVIYTTSTENKEIKITEHIKTNGVYMVTLKDKNRNLLDNQKIIIKQ